MNILKAAVRSLRAVQSSALSEKVVYRPRDGAESVVSAVIGRTVFHTRGEYGTWMHVKSRDFIIRAADLPIPPAKGDEIVFEGRVYEVLAPNGEDVWRWSDRYFTARRIHTKLTEDTHVGS